MTRPRWAAAAPWVCGRHGGMTETAFSTRTCLPAAILRGPCLLWLIVGGGDVKPPEHHRVQAALNSRPPWTQTLTRDARLACDLPARPGSQFRVPRLRHSQCRRLPNHAGPQFRIPTVDCFIRSSVPNTTSPPQPWPGQRQRMMPLRTPSGSVERGY